MEEEDSADLPDALGELHHQSFLDQLTIVASTQLCVCVFVWGGGGGGGWGREGGREGEREEEKEGARKGGRGEQDR